MNLKELLICLVMLSPGMLAAQYLEIGVSGGFSQYFGDLQSGYESKVNHLAFGAFGRYNLSRRLSIKAQFSQATLSGDDQNQKAFNTFEFNRNLSFQSKLYELAVVGEWNITKFDIRDGQTTAPYLFAGIAGFFNNPKAQIEGRWYDLQSIGTEGQTLEGGKKYSKFNVAFPIGAGLKISLNERINLGFEFGLRFSLSDYIDDVSGVYPNLALLEEQNPIASQLSFRSPELLPQLAGNPVGKPRGDANTKDGYFIGNITLSFNLVEGYDLEFDERLKKFSPNYRPKQQSLRSIKRELKREEKKLEKKPGNKNSKKKKKSKKSKKK